MTLPGIARATTYCVGNPGGPCDGTYPATGDGLQSAIDAADNDIPVTGVDDPDTVHVGPGTYVRSTPGSFHTNGGEISIVGSGRSTELGSTSSGPVLQAPTPAS